MASGLAQASARYAAHGLGTVRDPAVTPQEWQTYLRASADDRLAVRSHAMIFTTPERTVPRNALRVPLRSAKHSACSPNSPRWSAFKR